MIMHSLGGLWIGFTLMWILSKSESFKLSLRLIFKIILGVLLIGIAWEIFEFIFNNYIAQNPFDILDTLSDIFFDLFGSVFAILYFLKENYATIKERFFRKFFKNYSYGEDC